MVHARYRTRVSTTGLRRGRDVRIETDTSERKGDPVWISAGGKEAGEHFRKQEGSGREARQELRVYLESTRKEGVVPKTEPS